MEAWTAALVTIFRKKKKKKMKERKTSDVFCNILEYILWSGFCKETLSESVVLYEEHTQ